MFPSFLITTCRNREASGAFSGIFNLTAFFGSSSPGATVSCQESVSVQLLISLFVKPPPPLYSCRTTEYLADCGAFMPHQTMFVCPGIIFTGSLLKPRH